MVSFDRAGPPLVTDVDAFNEDYRDVREKVATKIVQGLVTNDDAGSTYNDDVRDLINSLKVAVNSIINQTSE
jgi:hypothetical protein